MGKGGAKGENSWAWQRKGVGPCVRACMCVCVRGWVYAHVHTSAAGTTHAGGNKPASQRASELASQLASSRGLKRLITRTDKAMCEHVCSNLQLIHKHSRINKGVALAVHASTWRAEITAAGRLYDSLAV